jgi:CheY-like chemotaxis protein
MLLKRKGDIVHTQYDAVLMDSSMPKMTGPEAAVARRGLGFLGAIIGLSGNIDPSEFVSAGADKVMIKPVSLVQLTECLSAVMDIRKNAPIDPLHGSRRSSTLLDNLRCSTMI